MIRCEICGEEFNNITWKHLKTHDITTDQYKILYPDAVLQSEETAKRRREHATRANKSRIGVKRSPDVIKKIKKSKANNPVEAWNKGIPRTQEQNRQLSEIRKQRFTTGDIAHWNTGRTTSTKTKSKISATLISQNNTYSEHSLQKRNETLHKKRENGWIHHSSRKISEQARLLLDDVDWLIQKHTIEHLTMNEIALLLGVDTTTVHKRFQSSDITVHRFPVSSAEKEIIQFLQSHDITNIVSNSRTMIPPLELDVYLPDFNIAIEYCGLYWHSHFHKPNNYHVNKLNECTKRGIRLITIFEDEWIHKSNIVKQKILSELKMDNRPVIFARNCKIITVSIQQKREFLSQNHIQGDGPGSINYGLIYNDELVAVMSFIKQKGQHILNRYATSDRVVGGASKLLKHFQKVNNWSTIISFADRRWSDGNLYKSTGWTLDATLPPDYSYVTQTTRVHKFNYRRSKLPKLLNDYDPLLSETQNTDNAGIPRIYNCGLLRFKIKNPHQ